MKSKKLVVLLSVLVLATAPAVVAATGCDNINNPTGTTQTDEYTFKFVGGDGATGTAPADVVKKADETFTLPANPFTKAGYTFAGWSDGSATPYDAGATYTVGTAGKTFTALWTAIDYKVSFVGGTGATGTVADITNKHIGDTVTLPANGFTKTGSTFIGWSVDGKTYGAGAEITIGTANVVATAVWFAEGTYSDSVNAGATVAFADGKATFTVKSDYSDDTYATEYDYAVKDGAFVFTDPEDEQYTYTGIYANGVLAMSVSVRISNYGYDDKTFVLASEILAPIDDMGTVNGYSQTYSMSDPIYMFENGVIVATVEETVGYSKVYHVKLGTYEKVGLHVYSATYYGDSKSYELKIEVLDDVSYYVMSDGLKGDYTFGSDAVTLDGYGTFNGGKYDYVTDGTDSMIALNYTAGGVTKLCEVSGNTITEVSAAGAGVYSYSTQYPTFDKIYYNGSNLVGLVYNMPGDDDHSSTVVIPATVDGNKKFTVTCGWDKVDIQFTQGAFKVKADYGYGTEEIYTLGGVEFVEPLPEGVTDGNYVNNLSSDITASIATENGVMKLTLTKGGSSTVYKVTAGDKEGEVFFKENGTTTVKTGYIVNGVIYVSGVKAGASTTYHVALTKEALTPVSGAEAGYFANPSDAKYLLYLYTNGVAVYRTYYYASSQTTSGKIATYTKDGDEYTLTFPDGSENKFFKVFADSKDTAAYYVEGDGRKGNYTIGSDTYTFDGFGGYTKGSETGKYGAGSNGFTLIKDNAVTGAYVITDGTVAEATETQELVNKGGNANTALTKEGIKVKGADEYIGSGCAVISYTVTVDGVEGEVQTIKVAIGMTFAIKVGEGDDAVTENFEVTKAADGEFIITRTNTDGSVASNAKNLTLGLPGGGAG